MLGLVLGFSVTYAPTLALTGSLTLILTLVFHDTDQRVTVPLLVIVIRTLTPFSMLQTGVDGFGYPHTFNSDRTVSRDCN